MPRGGKRAGAGRKPIPDYKRRKSHTFSLTDGECYTLKQVLEKMRLFTESGKDSRWRILYKNFSFIFSFEKIKIKSKTDI